MTIDRTPGAGKYAIVEREQRWLLSALPDRVSSPSEIIDRYVTDTTLRVRRVEAGDTTVYKLTQKVRPDLSDPEIVKITNIYLTEAEYAIVARLPAAELRKTRWRIPTVPGVAVDAFHGALEGLVLAEAELAAGAPYRPAPPKALRDVTHDNRFAGGALATAGAGFVRDALGPRARRD